MKRRSQQPANLFPEITAPTTDPRPTEEPLLTICELEPRLTPDGWGPGGNSHNNNPPGGQVGWGC
jgi:hypothetical protein